MGRVISGHISSLNLSRQKDGVGDSWLPVRFETFAKQIQGLGYLEISLFDLLYSFAHV